MINTVIELSKAVPRKAEADGKLADILQWMADVGIMLVPSADYGYFIKPVVGKNGWASQEEWNKEKTRCLMPYAEELKMILWRLKNETRM